MVEFIIEESQFPVCLEKPIKNALVKVDYAFAENSYLDISSGTDCFQIEAKLFVLVEEISKAINEAPTNHKVIRNGKDVKHKWGQFLANIARHGDQILDVAVDGEGEWQGNNSQNSSLLKQICNKIESTAAPPISIHQQLFRLTRNNILQQQPKAVALELLSKFPEQQALVYLIRLI
ncbi:hypothetical protein L6452_19596 [Arctium lappa]|uniref:Uncharacterized protein n=1 Tax=Arctium lappa TaxID=4217 RepID=A0ACB9B8K9_ARCLA|nr:hypothetical protein L6452_19596 [Arctium lappa]